MRQTLISALIKKEDFKSRNVEVIFFGKDLVVIKLWGHEIAWHTTFTARGAEIIVERIEDRMGHSDF